LDPESLDRLRKCHVRVLSQNVWNSFFEGGSCRTERPERLNAFCEYLRSEAFDIVAVQEQFVFGAGPMVLCTDADAWAEAMHSLGFIHQTSAVGVAPIVGMSSGLVVYSKLQIVSQKHTVFKGLRPFAGKGWLEVEVELPEGGPHSRLTVVNVHQEHSNEPKWKAVRETQWRELAARLSELLLQDGASAQQPVVMVGDFNVCSDECGRALDGSEEYTAMTGAFAASGLGRNLVSVQEFPSVRQEYLEDAPEGVTSQSLDHAFVSARLGELSASARIVDTRGTNGLPVSDHRAVKVELSGVAV